MKGNRMTFNIGDNLINSREIISRIEELESDIDAAKVDILASYKELTPDSKHWFSDRDEYVMETLYADYPEEIGELNDLKAFAEDLEGYGDWEYGETLIHEDYFEEYCQELVEDCYTIDVPDFIKNNIDWEGIASEMKADYMDSTIQGETYYMRV